MVVVGASVVGAIVVVSAVAVISSIEMLLNLSVVPCAIFPSSNITRIAS